MKPSILHLALAAAACLTAADASAQRGEKPPVIVENAGTTPIQTPDEAAGAAATPPPIFGGANNNPATSLFGGGATLETIDPEGPRPIMANQPRPFTDDRVVLEVDGQPITAMELQELVLYYQIYRPGSADILLRDAVEALIPIKAVQAHFDSALAGMKARADAAKEAVKSGREWRDVVAEFSQDDECPNDEGKYTFGREAAVQPFDRFAHSGKVGELKGPFLTKYGYHLLEILDYHRATEGKDDRTDVRHILVRFPFQSADARGEIRAIAAAAKIKIVDPGMRNLVPPEMRAQIVD